jgi:sugar phosphate isomerase/epimerase
MQISRRELFKHAGTGVAAVTALKDATASPLGLPIGTQVYPVRNSLGKDFDGTLRDLASMGYRTIEMCSPQGYGGSAFTPLASMTGSEMRKRIQAAGLTCESSHYTFRELKENLPERIAYAKELGLKQMILASFSIRDGSLSDWARAAGELNKIAEETRKAGIQAGFHNHDGEFKQIDGVLIYDKLMSELDPKLVKMQYQVAVGRLGFDAPVIFEKYSGRFLSLHLQDWSPGDKKMTPIGQGAVDWKKLFPAAKKAGVKNYFVEVEPDLMKESYTYLQGLK